MKEHEEKNGATCPRCGYRREPLPRWGRRNHQLFWLNAQVYRQVSYGSTNQGIIVEHLGTDNWHFIDYVTAEMVTGIPKNRFGEPDVYGAIGDIETRELFKFTPKYLRRAVLIAPDFFSNKYKERQ